MPSTRLAGLTTDSGWEIVSRVAAKQVSGGTFCARYLARGPSGEDGFLKAMDLSRALSGGLTNVRDLIEQYLFERETLFSCRDRKMSRIVTPLDAGEITVASQPPPLNTVYYVVFEKADGDLRQQHLDAQDPSWLAAFRALHHVCVGTAQLHAAGIAHQDIKPSNILNFPGDVSKIADLGRVTDLSGKSPFGNSSFTGDFSYAPFEHWFGYRNRDFYDRYLSDMFMVGSLLHQVITQVSFSHAVETEAKLIAPPLAGMTYADALPYLTTASATILDRLQSHCDQELGARVARKVVEIVREMCNPIIDQRGNTKSTDRLHRLSMHRYVGKFATLVQLAKVEGIR